MTVDVIIVAGQIAGALLAVGGLLSGGWWAARKLVHIADAVKELSPNGGGSIKDQITRIDSRLTALEDALGVKQK